MAHELCALWFHRIARSRSSPQRVTRRNCRSSKLQETANQLGLTPGLIGRLRKSCNSIRRATRGGGEGPQQAARR